MGTASGLHHQHGLAQHCAICRLAAAAAKWPDSAHAQSSPPSVTHLVCVMVIPRIWHIWYASVTVQASRDSKLWISLAKNTEPPCVDCHGCYVRPCPHPLSQGCAHHYEHIADFTWKGFLCSLQGSWIRWPSRVTSNSSNSILWCCEPVMNVVH